MTLRDWLHANKKTASEFAKELGIAHNYLLRIKNGYIKPGKYLAIQIEIMTGGKVTVSELRGTNENN